MKDLQIGRWRLLLKKMGQPKTYRVQYQNGLKVIFFLGSPMTWEPFSHHFAAIDFTDVTSGLGGLIC